MNDSIILLDVLKAVIRAYREGSVLRTMVIVSVILLVLSVTAFIMGAFLHNLQERVNIVGAVSLLFSFLICVSLSAYYTVTDRDTEKEKYQALTERVQENPEEAKSAWDLARIRLESYLDRNLNQLRWIYCFCIIAMVIGFVIMIIGVIKVYQAPFLLKPSIVVMLSGAVFEFIASTFLIIYSSTMKQATGYVDVLERINAVGMSVQVLDSIQGNADVKNKARSELVKELLSLYKKQSK